MMSLMRLRLNDRHWLARFARGGLCDALPRSVLVTLCNVAADLLSDVLLPNEEVGIDDDVWD
jgi:hypothetical protein